MRTAVATGATGFIGRRLCEQLRRNGWRVTAVARREAPGPWDEFVVHDFGLGSRLRLPAAPEVVFHLAGRTHALGERPGETDAYFRVNLGGMRELLTALENEPATRIVFTSSVKAHGEQTPVEGVDESSEPRPTTAYGQSKLAAEQALLDSPLGRRAIVLRLAMVFGPEQKGNLADMIQAVGRRRFPPIPETGNRRSMVHVDDVVEALLAAAEAPEANSRVYFLAHERTRSSGEIYAAVCSALNRPVPDWRVPATLLRWAGRAGAGIGRLRGRRFVWDSDKFAKLFGSAHYRSGRAAAELGVRPKIDLEQALPSMIHSREI
jgi:nucleoside-diphosphate-sugar epimerase